MNSSNILVFKTNIQSVVDKERIRSVMDRQDILRWNVDAADVDCVLRVESMSITPLEVIQLINDNGYLCQELE